MIQFPLKNIKNMKVNFEVIDTERGCARKMGKSNTFFSGDKIFAEASEGNTKFYMTKIR